MMSEQWIVVAANVEILDLDRRLADGERFCAICGVPVGRFDGAAFRLFQCCGHGKITYRCQRHSE